MTGEPHIDYDALALDAMRGLVRNVLARTAKSGLPGDHHFYVSFDTEAPGVTLSKRLKERYPREMTIVLQHRFWDLIVTDDRFEVKLSFDSIPERLVVPFSAIKVFFDPSVQYGLRFEDGEPADAGETTQPSSGLSGPRAVPRTGPKKPRPAKKTKAGDPPLVAVQPHGVPSPPLPLTPRPSALTPVTAAPQSSSPTASSNSDTPDGAQKPGNGAQIVSLDQFRKK